MVSDASQECFRQREGATKGRGPHRKPARYKTPPQSERLPTSLETRICAVAAKRMVTLRFVRRSVSHRAARVHRAPLARATPLHHARRVSLVLFHPWG